MTNYENFILMSIEQLAQWINTNGQFDGSPWMKWFDENYCSKCESVTIKKADAKDVLGFELMFCNETTCSYCEVHKKCKFFPEFNEAPNLVEIIEMWLKEKIDE